MINLFERYTANEVDLEHSLLCSGYTHQTVVLEDDGYLPDHILSPLRFFLGEPVEQKRPPLFFNALNVPYFWEIKGDNRQAEIYDGYKKKGIINYSQRKGDYRSIASVTWLNDEGRIRSVQLYNKFGECFGKQTYSDGQLALTTYFDAEQREVILYHHVTKIIELHYQGKDFIFSDTLDFILFFIKVSGLDVSQMIYNSLGLPFFISNKLQEVAPNAGYDHWLFWQEESAVLPENMKYLMASKASPTQKIIVQNWREFLNIKAQVAKDLKLPIQYLGFIFDFKKEVKRTHRALILTHSDEVLHLKALAQILPHLTFEVAAYTEMSTKLLALGKQANIELYPNINDQELETLLESSDLYLDINGGSEAGGILRKSFDYNLLGFGFSETQHDSKYTTPSNVFPASEYKAMASLINNLTRNEKIYQEAVINQQHFAGQSSVQDYKRILK